MSDTDAVFAALADKTRRSIVEVLVQGPRSPSELASTLHVSPQALSRHLRQLRRARLVRFQAIDSDARVKIYQLEGRALAPLRNWLERSERLWNRQLAAFKDYAERPDP
jgi:DNA-binding transcriptional ArsR family regulator